MDHQLRQRIERINAKLWLLQERSLARERNLAEATAKAEEQGRELAVARATNGRLQSELTMMKNARALEAPADASAAERRELKILLSELVREIDSCIRDLTR